MFTNRKKKEKLLLSNQKELKQEYFDFDRISLFFENEEHKEVRQIIDDQTLKDLDFEDFFIAVDRTASPVGQQYLYSKLRTLPKNYEQAKIYEKYVQHLEENEESRIATVLNLKKLDNEGAYFIQRLFFGDNIAKPKWFWLIPAMSLLAVLTLLASIFFKPLLLLALLLMAINTLIHLWNKNNVLGYSNSIPQLLKLRYVANELHKTGVLLDLSEPVQASLKSLNKIKRWALFFKWESSSLGELAQIFEYALDLLKGAFLIEPIVFFRMLKQIESNKENIKTIYEAVGTLDIVLSIFTWRESLHHYCQPEFSDAKKTWNGSEIFHPLIENPVSNNLSIDPSKSILLSGSNMSGKTTFIRTIGINTLLAQTLNIACARELTISRFNISSAIRISDDLLEDTSYYYEEVKTIKKLTEESNSGNFNLFLLDEIFKGTNTIERIASGKAVLSYLNGKNNLVLCSTHDFELIDFLNEEYEYYYFEETIAEGQLFFGYKLQTGSMNNTNAIRILEMNNFPTALTEEAKDLASNIANQKTK